MVLDLDLDLDLQSSSPFKRLHQDLLADIMARLDGPALAAAACTCTDFLQLAREQRLWKHLCQSTWPSTRLEEAQCLFSPAEAGGFRKFYAESYPLVTASHVKDDDRDNIDQDTEQKKWKQSSTCVSVSPSDFVSLIDVHYRGKCVLSRVLDGIPEAVDIDNGIGSGSETRNSDDVLADDRQRWFSECPFKLDLLSYNCDEDNDDEDRYEEHEADDGRRGLLPPVSKEDHCGNLANDLRLSWVLLDKKTGNAVNLSSWKPMSVQKSWPSEGEYMINFGCIVPVDEGVLTQKLAKCTIVARCRLGETAGSLGWREISMIIEDMNGAHLNGRKSSLVLNQALYSSRSINEVNIEKGFSQYEKQKKDMMKRKVFTERVVDSLCLTLEITAFVCFCYAFNLV